MSQTRDALGERLAEVASHGARQPVDVLDDGGPVGAVLLVVRGDRLGRRIASENGASDVARQELRRGEHDRAQQEERDEGEAEALQDVASDRRQALVVAGGRRVPPAARVRVSSS